MIGKLVVQSLLSPSIQDEALGKYLASEAMTRVDRFVLMIVLAGDRLAEYLEDDDQETAMDAHDAFAECFLNLRLFGDKPQRPSSSISESKDSKRETTLFRIRKSNISVSKPVPLLKSENSTSKMNLSISQVTRPGTTESSSSGVRLNPISKGGKILKGGQQLNQLQVANSLFSVSFAAKQDLAKKTGKERALVLTSVLKRFASSVQTKFGLPLKNCLEHQSLENLASELADVKQNVCSGALDPEVKILLSEGVALKLEEAKLLKDLIDQCSAFDIQEILKVSGGLQTEVEATCQSKDIRALRLALKSVVEKMQAPSASKVTELAASLICFGKVIQIARSTKCFLFASIMQDLENSKKLCSWFAKCVSIWGKLITEFKEEACESRPLFSDTNFLLTENLAALKHFYSYLKFASSMTSLPPAMVPSMEYYLFENRDVWKSLLSTN